MIPHTFDIDGCYKGMVEYQTSIYTMEGKEVDTINWHHADKAAMLHMEQELEARIVKGEKLVYEQKQILTIKYTRVSWQHGTKRPKK